VVVEVAVVAVVVAVAVVLVVLVVMVMVLVVLVLVLVLVMVFCPWQRCTLVKVIASVAATRMDLQCSDITHDLNVWRPGQSMLIATIYLEAYTLRVCGQRA
jgi:hypothetical protein